MSIIYVAHSKSLGEWGADVGLTKHLYLVGVAAGDAAAVLDALNRDQIAGQSDWTITATRESELDEASVLERLARKERAVDPRLYPKINRARGVFKVKERNVENHFVVKHALAGGTWRAGKPKPADFAQYLIANATE